MDTSYGFTKLLKIFPITANNKYQTDQYFLESCYQMTIDCLLTSGSLPMFDCFCVLGT